MYNLLLIYIFIQKFTYIKDLYQQTKLMQIKDLFVGTKLMGLKEF